MAPSHATDWIRLQAALAWHPERVAPLLRAGRSPAEILIAARDAASAGGPHRPPVPSGAAELERDLERTLGRLESIGARLVPLTHPAYPEALAALEDPPLVLALRGQIAAFAPPSLAIVGARAATREARGLAARFGRELASAGMTIVSGLARGIDAEAHRGALEARGRTIAVLACGIDRIYPPEHRRLADEICERGAVLTELPLGASPRRSHFPLRNRIISGLSRGILVVEARRRSGSLITVRHALTQGREVFVVPGSVEGPFAEGTNQLLREGARAVRSARDVLEDLGLEITRTRPAHPRSIRAERPFAGSGEAGCSGSASGAPAPDRLPPSAPASVGAVEGPLAVRLLEVLARGPATREQLILEAGLDASRLARLLFELQLEGLVEEERDGRIHAVQRTASSTRTGPRSRSARTRSRADDGGGGAQEETASRGADPD